MPPKEPARRFKLNAGDQAILNTVTPDRYDIFSRYYFDVELFRWQDYYLRYPAKNKLVVAGIRTGKSFTAALSLLHHGYYNPFSRCLNVCITADQSQVIFNEIVTLANSPKFAHWVDKIIYHPYPVIRLVNESEIWCRSIGGTSGTADSIRGWEFDIVNVDEAAYVVNEMAIRTLQGRLIGYNKKTGKPRYGLFSMGTTPKGAKTWLYERWKLGDPQYPASNPRKYLSIRARTFDNILLDPEQIEMIMQDYTEQQRLQELEGVFLSGDGMYQLEDLVYCAGKDLGADILDLSTIDLDILELEKLVLEFLKQKDPKIKDIPQNVEYYELDPVPGHAYVAGWDLGARAVLSGKAEGRNATVGVVFDISIRPWRMVAFRYVTGTRYTNSMQWVKDWHDKYNSRGATCITRIDALGPGDVIHQMLEEDQYKIDGFKASSISKGTMLQASAVAIERRLIRWPFIRRAIDQFQAYTPDDKNIAQDIVIAVSQALHLAREIEGGLTHDEAAVKRETDRHVAPAGSTEARSGRKAWANPNRRTR